MYLLINFDLPAPLRLTLI